MRLKRFLSKAKQQERLSDNSLFTNFTPNYKIRISKYNIKLKNRKLCLVKLSLQYSRISVRMIAQYSNSKLETFLYTYMKQRKKWRRRRRNLIAGIIQSLKNRNGKLYQINFTCLTLLENQLFTKKRNRRFRRLPRSNTFWWESVWNSYSDDRKAFVFLVPCLRLYYPIYDTNL